MAFLPQIKKITSRGRPRHSCFCLNFWRLLEQRAVNTRKHRTVQMQTGQSCNNSIMRAAFSAIEGKGRGALCKITIYNAPQIICLQPSQVCIRHLRCGNVRRCYIMFMYSVRITQCCWTPSRHTYNFEWEVFMDSIFPSLKTLTSTFTQSDSIYHIAIEITNGVNARQKDK